jgi:hypothetical protein
MEPIITDDSFIVEDMTKVTGSLLEYIFDIIYIQWFIQITTLIHRYFWFFYLVIPIFIIYKLGGIIYLKQDS